MKKAIRILALALVLAASALLVVPTFESESTPVVSGIGMADSGGG